MSVTSFLINSKRNASQASSPERTGFVVSDLMALILLLFAVVGALQNRTLFALVAALVLAVVLVSRAWTRLALEGVRYTLLPAPARVFEGDELTLTLIIENHKRLPVSRIKIRERLPPGLDLLGREESTIRTIGATVFDAVTSLAANERVRLNYRLKANRRGHYVFGPSRIEAGDPFGFYTTSREMFRSSTDFIVYPKLHAAPPIEPLLARPMGDVVSSFRSFDDPNLPASVREYRPGDPMRTIDWKVTARRGCPHVRINDASLSGAVVILLECDTRSEELWEESPELLERCVSMAASVAANLISLRYSVGLLTNGVPPGDRTRIAVPPTAGTRQLGTILEALARVQTITVSPLPDLVAANAQRLLPFGASVICVSGVERASTSNMLSGLAARRHPALLARVTDPRHTSGTELALTRFLG